MVPVTMLAVIAATVVLDHRSSARDAATVNAGVAKLSDLVAMRDGLLAQQSLEAFDVRFEQLGVTTADASKFIGIDLVARLGPARTRTNDAIAAIGPDNPISDAALHDLYAAIDGDTIDPKTAEGRLAASPTRLISALSAGSTRWTVRGQGPVEPSVPILALCALS